MSYSSTHSPSALHIPKRTSTLMLAALGAVALAAVVLAIVLSTNGSSSSTNIDRVTPSQAATYLRQLSVQPGVVQNAAAPASASKPAADLAGQPGVARLSVPGRFSVPGHEH
jgi:hypothetical protein